MVRPTSAATWPQASRGSLLRLLLAGDRHQHFLLAAGGLARFLGGLLRSLLGRRPADGTARLWDSDGKPLVIVEGHTGPVNSAVFAPDGGRILTASDDKTARLWNRDAILQGHTDKVLSAVFAPDSGRILTASDDGTARLWEAFPKPQTLIDRVKAEVPRCLTPAQRQRFFLRPTPPRWCVAMHKWPYDNAMP